MITANTLQSGTSKKDCVIAINDKILVLREERTMLRKDTSSTRRVTHVDMKINAAKINVLNELLQTINEQDA